LDTIENAVNGFLENSRDLMKIVVKMVDIVQQVQQRQNSGDRGSLGQQMGDTREQIGILTNGTQEASTGRLNSDKAEKLLEDDCASLTGSVDDASQSLVDQQWNLVNVVAELVNIVQQIEQRKNLADRGSFRDQVSNAREQVGILTESTQDVSTGRLNSDETEKLLKNDCASLTCTVDDASQSLVDQQWNLVNVIAELMNIVQQIEQCKNLADRGSFWHQVSDAREQVGILTESTQDVSAGTLLRSTIDSTDQLLDGSLTSLSCSTEDGSECVVDQRGNFVNIVRQLVNVVEQVQHGQNCAQVGTMCSTAQCRQQIATRKKRTKRIQWVTSLADSI